MQEKLVQLEKESKLLQSDENEKAVLIASLLYAVDKVANTVGHYDAFQKDT